MAYYIKHFKDTFESYSCACAQGFEKIPYKEWREIKDYITRATYISLIFSDKLNEVKLRFYFGNYETTDVTFKIKKPNFGFFLQGIYYDASQKVIKFYSDSEEKEIRSYQEVDLDCVYAKKTETRKENETMNTNKMFNFEFGRCSDNVRMSMYGLAVRGQDGRYVSYDKANDSMVDVEVFNFEGSNFFFKMPVAIKDIVAGDVVIHMKKPMFVKSIEEGKVHAIDIYSGEEKLILPIKNQFGFNFYTKVVNILEGFGNATPDAENPFGNMWMLAALDGEMDMSTMALMIFANQGSIGKNMNPLMFAAMLSQDEDMKKLLPFMFMGGMGK